MSADANSTATPPA